MEKELRRRLKELVLWSYCTHETVSLRQLIESGHLSAVYNALNPPNSTQDVDLADATAAWRLEMDLGCSLNAVMDSVSPRLRTIGLERTLSPSPRKLADLADEFGVSRQRVSQLESRLKDEIAAAVAHQFGVAGESLRNIHGAVVTASQLRRSCQLLLEGISDRYEDAAIHLLVENAGYSIEGGYATTEQFDRWVEHISASTNRLFETSDVLPEEELRSEYEELAHDPLWTLLLQKSGCVHLNGFWVRRDTHQARIITVLLNMGLPATAEEIAREADLPLASTRAALSSSDSVVRVTKDEWGLSDWTDDPFDGVPGEILQRIRDNGGRARIEELRQQISTRFKVSPATVDAYLRTAKFAVEEGWVRLADLDDIELRPLEDVEQVVWLEGRMPVFRFVADAPHLQGQSLKVPPEVAVYLGVSPDQAKSIPVKVPDESPDASVIWRAHDPSGPEIGRLKSALEGSEIQPGQYVYIVLAEDGLEVTSDLTDVRPDRLPMEPPKDHGTPSSPSRPMPSTKRARDLVEQIKSRRQL